MTEKQLVRYVVFCALSTIKANRKTIDFIRLGAALSTFSETRANSPHSQLQVAKMFEVSKYLIPARPNTYDSPQTEGTSPYRAERDRGIWRLVFNNTSEQTENATEEVVSSVQGILCKNGLPPFLDQIG